MVHSALTAWLRTIREMRGEDDSIEGQAMAVALVIITIVALIFAGSVSVLLVALAFYDPVFFVALAGGFYGLWLVGRAIWRHTDPEDP